MAQPGLHSRNWRMLTGLFVLVAGMVGLSYAAVPLYDLFCRVTGYGGTTQVAEEAPEQVLDREIRIRFMAETDRRLPWDFAPEEREVTIRVGEAGLAFYTAENLSDEAITGMAGYNVLPPKAGVYFNKIQCFCFDEQTLAAGQSVDMPVYFFVDPAIDDDPNLDEVRTITLSYTFFRSGNDQGAEADSSDRSAGAGNDHSETILAAADGR